MPTIKSLLLTFCLIIVSTIGFSQVIWQEDFTTIDKGIWGDDDGTTIHSDLNNIPWSLQYNLDSISLNAATDYAKTVSTSGGRFECRDIDGEITWLSEPIDISTFPLVKLSMTVKEIGSGNNQSNKYIKLFVKIDNNTEINISDKRGNWGTELLTYDSIQGNSMQIIAKLSTFYASDKIVIDDILVEKQKVTKLFPQIDSIAIISSHQIKIFFSKDIKTDIITIDNFRLFENNNSPININSFSSLDNKTVIIDFETPSTNKITLEIYNIKGVDGNNNEYETASFDFYQPLNQYDVVFNELMIDPTPVVKLPNSEYIELRNRTSDTLNTLGWKLIVNDKEIELAQGKIKPDGFLVLTKLSHIDSLRDIENIQGLTSWKALRNSDAILTLQDRYGNSVDQFSYHSNWMNKLENSKGGYSLERVDINRNCNQPQNWLFSQSVTGGTPGKINSVANDNLDLVSPELISAHAVSESTIKLIFTEQIVDEVLMDRANYTFDNNLAIEKIEIVNDTSIILQLLSPLELNRNYQLTISNMVDFCQNIMETIDVEINWYEIEEGDILINEILFNAVQGGNEYVEIVNNSQKVIDLNRLYLARINVNGELIQKYQLTTDLEYIEPSAYLALTKDTNGVFPFYMIKCYTCFLQMEKFPTYTNDEGTVVILNEHNVVIDQFHYYEEMHNKIYWDESGISLERFSLTEVTNTNDNWHSASSLAGYGTPGYKNSQSEIDLKDKVTVTFEPNSFSPNFDGFNDTYNIHYELDSPNYTANILIFDTGGNYLMNLANNDLLSTEGDINWDGTNVTGQRMPLGIYIVLVKLLSPDGKIYQYKNSVVLTDPQP